jgi:general secretion pathway protein D
LLIGRPEAVQSVIDLVRRLDIPVGPASMFQVFPLQHASASAAKQTIDGFFLSRAGLSGTPTVVTDFRTNSLIVQGSPSDLQEVQALLRKIDVASTPVVNELRVFQLRNSTAEDMAQTLQDAISADDPNANQQQQQQPGGFQLPGQIQQQQQQQGQQNRQGSGGRSTALRFVTVDGDIRQGLRSGILTDVRITADPAKNTLLVSAPAESMDLIAALIQQLDEMPAAQVQIKVFTVVNGDVATLTTMLQNLFGQQANQQNQGGGGFFGGFAPQQDGGTLVPLRFSYDQRTNSIIASGSANELLVVEAVLGRLDDINVRTRESTVYRLKNVPALDVANAIMQYLQTERQLQQQLQPQGTLSPFEQIEREVVVVPEPVSNSLIVSATPRFYREVIKLIEDIDRRPPMAMIQVLIAEVTLNNTDEFGVELGLQDSVLFDRSLVGVPNFVTRTVTTTLNPSGTQTTTQQVVGASNDPGFDWNNAANPVLPNSASDRALDRSGHVGTQGLSQFGMGRVNSELGYGGFVFSASSEGVSALLRALAECRRLDVLSRPQVMTLDNQPAYIQVGQRVPRVNATTITQTGQTNSVILDNIGIILGVTPRISPDGLVVMQIDATKSELGPESEGIPISINETGQVIRSPIYNTTVASTTVSALDAQTVVLGGLITSRKDQRHRRVPYLSNLPIIGQLFRYDYTSQRRTELLIIMTPHIVRNQDDADRIKQMESARMSWCLGDVIKLDGDRGLRGRNDEFGDNETQVVYPDVENMPTPATPPVEELGTPPQGTPTLGTPPTQPPPAPNDPTLLQGKKEEKKKSPFSFRR